MRVHRWESEKYKAGEWHLKASETMSLPMALFRECSRWMWCGHCAMVLQGLCALEQNLRPLTTALFLFFSICSFSFLFSFQQTRRRLPNQKWGPTKKGGETTQPGRREGGVEAGGGGETKKNRKKRGKNISTGMRITKHVKHVHQSFHSKARKSDKKGSTNSRDKQARCTN